MINSLFIWHCSFLFFTFRPINLNLVIIIAVLALVLDSSVLLSSTIHSPSFILTTLSIIITLSITSMVCSSSFSFLTIVSTPSLSLSVRLLCSSL